MRLAPLVALILPACAACAGSGAGPVGRYQLTAGSYVITALRDRSDGCQIDSDPARPLVGSRHELVADERGNVELRGFGSGVVSDDQGRLSTSGRTTAGPCTYDYESQVDLRLTGDDRFTAGYTEVQRNRDPSCTPQVGGECTSTWQMDLERVE